MNIGRSSFSLGSRDDLGLDVVALVLGLVDLDEVGHDFLVFADSLLSVLHNLDLDSEDTRIEAFAARV